MYLDKHEHFAQGTKVATEQENPVMSSEKKRKRNDGSAASDPVPDSEDLDTSKPSAVFNPKGGRSWTLSVALPGSIVANAQSHDKKTYLAGQIARALAVFCVDEVVIFDDGNEGPEASIPVTDDQAYTAFSHPSHFLSHLLSFLETPAHLRKALFPTHQNLSTAGALPSLDMPHHLKKTEWCDYREGVVTRSDENESWVDAGLAKQRVVKGTRIPVGARVTVKMVRGTNEVEVVGPSEPREIAGYYWGYSVRQCSSLSAVLTECPFDGGYDLSIGMSERGKPLADVDFDDVPPFQRQLLVFGGVAGLEAAVAVDEELAGLGITKNNVGELFDMWINFLPGQGSKTIRTEEAVWLGLMGTNKLRETR